eukprot:2768055-Rhodomonas_salina.1
MFGNDAETVGTLSERIAGWLATLAPHLQADAVSHRVWSSGAPNLMGGCDFWYAASRDRHALELYARIARRHSAGEIYRLDYTAMTGTEKND